MPSSSPLRIIGFLALATSFTLPPCLGGEGPLSFEVKWLAIDANEGCDIADVNQDGILDVIAGRNWYNGVDWLPRPVRLIEDWNGYTHSNGEHALDVNKDGFPDIVSQAFVHSTISWYENPGLEGLKQGQLWKQHLLVDSNQQHNEASFLEDVNGDGVPEFIANQWKKDNGVFVWTFDTREELVEITRGPQRWKEKQPVPALRKIEVGSSANGHGMGFGDINNDGLEDILVGMGWYQRPKGDPFKNSWTFHQDWNIDASCPLFVRDFNHDGKNDLLWGKGHDYGLVLWTATAEPSPEKLKFNESIIDDTFSQAHCLHFADIDGDGDDELITGKRVRAHNGNDPGGKEAPLICYYEIDSEGQFTRHIIEQGTVGTGLQIRTADLENDGDLDIVVAGKEGTQILFNQSSN